MELGMIGLGKMGAYMTERLVRGGHRVIGFDRDPAAVKNIVDKGAAGADSLEKFIAQLKSPRVVWLMVPAGAPVDQTIDLLTPHFQTGDTIIDGGNSFYKDSVRRAAALAEKKFNFVDCGTSGGVWGLTEGYSMMVGGDADVVKRLSPIFETLAPGPDKGWGRVGPAGIGPFCKDGPQRNRIWNDAGLCRRPRFASPQEGIRPRPFADFENLAIRQRDPIVAAGSHGGCAFEKSHAGRHWRLCYGFGRRALDRHRRCRTGRRSCP